MDVIGTEVVKRVLDLGAQSLIFPYVQTAEEVLFRGFRSISFPMYMFGNSKDSFY